jgi:hypothetical protein
VLAAVAVTIVTATPSAAGAPGRSLPIRLGVGIGPINLGMSGQQVRRALGPPGAVLERRTLRGQPYTELQWREGAWNVGLLGRKGKRRVVLVGTGLTRHRTPEGVGVGTSERQIARRLRGLRERYCDNPHGTTTHHWYLRRGRSETVFVPIGRATPTGGVRRTVAAVEVRGGAAVGCAVP